LSAQYILRGRRFRGAESARIEARLVERVGAEQWSAILRPAQHARAGDRLRFGESSESLACMLGFLDAEVVAISGVEAVLAFAFSDAALDEALERLGRPTQL
jgi:S-adenosylmethionine:tRNA ribosyltransferase-isomerase